MTSGMSIEIGWPSMAASASMPPTPQPTTPSPFTIVVCESVPTSVSGYAVATPPASSRQTTLARYSMFTWCTMPVSGGTTRKLRNASWPHLRNAYRSRLRANSSCAFRSGASGRPKWSTCTE